ncbi:hypothetical protein BGZ49_003970 [Haplosporangium sp. Z 27]|nr:hypothetical protein BGZ49_003970 [Haplosporangium sp. Z 27]
MSSMMNDTEITMVVPNAIPGRIYIPQTINYTVGCGDVGLSALMRTGAFVLRNTGCARIHVTVLGVIDYDETGVIVTKRSSERWSISVPAVFYDIIAEMSVGARVIQNNVTCATWSVLGGVMDSPRDGQTSLPTTLSTKCMYPSGNVTSLSLSAIRFMTSTVGQFSNVSKTSFNEYDELFQAMELNLNNSNGAQGNCTLFAEVQYVNDTVNTLSCYTAPNPNNNITFVTCTYVIIRAIIISQQDLNPTIAATLEEGGSPPDLTTIMTFTHMPNSNGNRSAETSISAIRNINSVVADYIASLGQNLCVDWNHGQVTIMFDTTDTEGGLSIPFWLIVSVPVIAVICAILLGSTEYFLDGRYTTSLYKAISMPMRSRMNSFAPMLMRSRVDPVEFEGIPVVPSGRGFETDLKNVATIQSDRSSSTTLVHQKHSSFL